MPARRAKLRIATFNINGILRRLDNLMVWLAETKPDIVCLQELKAEHGAFPEGALNSAGYDCTWLGQKSWNGVAILSRIGAPILIRNELPGDPKDKQSRYLEAAVAGMVIACLYAPNGNPQPGPKFDYKLAWMARLHKHARGLIKSGAPVILCGDYNVVPTDADIYPSTSWDDNALLQPESRKAYFALLKQGWTDAIRHLHPDATIYTFWDYLRKRWERNGGLRIDHLLITPDLVPQLHRAGVDREVRGQPGASDHAPAWIELKRA